MMMMKKKMVEKMMMIMIMHTQLPAASLAIYLVLLLRKCLHSYYRHMNKYNWREYIFMDCLWTFKYGEKWRAVYRAITAIIGPIICIIKCLYYWQCVFLFYSEAGECLQVNLCESHVSSEKYIYNPWNALFSCLSD